MKSIVHIQSSDFNMEWGGFDKLRLIVKQNLAIDYSKFRAEINLSEVVLTMRRVQAELLYYETH